MDKFEDQLAKKWREQLEKYLFENLQDQLTIIDERMLRFVAKRLALGMPRPTREV